jgi:hypothetical protein
MGEKANESTRTKDVGSPSPFDNLDSVRTAQIAKSPDYKKEPLAGLPAIEELKTYLQTHFDLLDLNHDGRIRSDEIYAVSTKLAALDDAKSCANAKPVEPVELDTGYTAEMFLANDFSHPQIRKQAPQSATRQPKEADPPTSKETDSPKLGSANDKKNIEALNTTEVYTEINANNLLEDIFTPGISRKGLDSLGSRIDDYKKWRSEQKEAVPFAYTLANYGTANFQKLDKNNDGRISFDELNEALKSSSNPDDRQKLEALETLYDSILYPPSIPRPLRNERGKTGIERPDFDSFLNSEYGIWLYRLKPDKLKNNWQLRDNSYSLERCDAKWRTPLLDQ